MRFDELLRDREAEPEPAVARGRGVALAKPLEHVRQELAVDADAVVGDAQLVDRPERLERDVHCAAGPRVADRVSEQVAQRSGDP